MERKAQPRREVPEWVRGDPLMEWYALEVWGNRIRDDDALFEIMSLQVFQAGLTWRMILLRRDAFRKAFKGWRIERVARITPRGVERLVQDASIIRNRKKIEACIENARTVRGIQGEHGSFCRWFYDVLDGDELPPLQKSLRATFKFMGPEIARMWLLASGRLEPAG
ncbi:MAG: DNA-3-methyladenine glycosylase I [Dehalococcoidia bacterium]